MIETAFLLFGIGFSILVYFRSIRKTSYPATQKILISLLTFIGIIGTLFLFGILIAHFLRKASNLLPLR